MTNNNNKLRSFASAILFALVSICALADNTKISSISEISSTKKYIIQNVGNSMYLAFQSDFSETNVVNATPLVSNSASASQFIISGSNGGYTISDGNHYIGQSTTMHWNTSATTTAKTWTISVANASLQTFYIKGDDSNYLKYDGTYNYAYYNGSEGNNNTAWYIYEVSDLSTGGGETGGGETGGGIVAPTDRTFSESWVENQSVLGMYKEDAHATFIPYTSIDQMKSDVNYDKAWLTPEKAEYISLNGTWKFKFTSNRKQSTLPGESDFYGTNATLSGFNDIHVPLSWEMAGYGRPVYINEGGTYPFQNNPPSINAQSRSDFDGNPVGSYRRDFDIPASWDGKQIFLHFDGAYSAIAIWINGGFVGYSQGSNTDAEFDITNYVETGTNNVSVRCYKYSDGSYLESQDMWRLGGIHRDVYLVATPNVFVSNHKITSNLNNGYTSGSMSVELTLDNRTDASASRNIEVQLIDATGHTVATKTTSISANANGTQTVNVSFNSLTGLTPWSAENPYLYTVVVNQQNGANTEMAFSTKYGFRTITTSKYVSINGQRVYFKGVNSQDTHPAYGRAIDMETMLKDVELMKKANVNTIRTSHYPRQPKMYAMFDYYGLYCMDEADVECHSAQSLTSNTSWANAFIDRTERMVKRDINHPSIIFWSLGNECGTGSNLNSSYNAVKALDTSRPVHYSAGSVSYSDLASNMYRTVDQVSSMAAGSLDSSKPYFICEYAHAMGNGVGNLQEYWDAIIGSSNGIGGCIWDWVDQAIFDPAKIYPEILNGESKNFEDMQDDFGFSYWTAGYDYQSVDASSCMGNFLDNGILTPNRKWSAKLTEVKSAYKYVKFNSFNNKSLSITNNYYFTPLSSDEFYIKYFVLKDGFVVEEGRANLNNISVGSTGSVNIPYTTSTTDDCEYVVRVQLCLAKDKTWAKAGYDIAEAQYIVKDRPSLPTVVANGTLNYNSSTRTVSGGSGDDAFEIVFNDNGSIKSWTYGSHNVINPNATNNPAFNGFRNVENQRGDGFYSSQSNTIKGTFPTASSGSTMTIVESGNYSASSASSTYTITYTIYPNGVVDMKTNITKVSGTLWRIGIGMELAEGLEHVEYYAKGPWANYVDREQGSFLGRYSTTVYNLWEEYATPQTNGDHQDLRNLILTHYDNLFEVDIKTEGKVAFSLSHYDEKQWAHTLWSTKYHNYDLTYSPQIYAHFDYFQRGLGNGSCGAGILDKYSAPQTNVPYTYTLRFTPSNK